MRLLLCLCTLILAWLVNVALAGCLYPPDANGHVNVPEGVTSLDNYAFDFAAHGRNDDPHTATDVGGVGNHRHDGAAYVHLQRLFSKDR